MAQRLTLLLNHAAAEVITAMRYNSKWAVVPRYYEEDQNEPSKYDDAFRALRSEIFKHQDWTSVDPMVYLTPFLTLIKASDVSGPVTGAAAVALQRILQSELLTPNTKNVEGAINQIVEDATQCKFESTNNSSDEIVLLNIVQVLGQAVDSAAGVLLSDESICKAVQAAFMLGDPVTKPKEYGDIMGYYSRQTCGNMIRTVFKNVAAQLVAQQAALEAGEPLMEPTCRYGVRAAINILEFLIDLIQKGPTLQGATKETVEETIIFSLGMVHLVLSVAGHALVLEEALARLVQVDLLAAMCQAVVQYNTVSVITGFCQVLLAIYTFMGHISIGQIELVLERVLLRLADGKSVTALEQQEAALEGVLDLCRQPGFVHDIFANCDCRIERANLFEDICALISKTALPVSKNSAGPLTFISLEALLAVFNALALSGRMGLPLLPPPSPATDLPFHVDLWGPLSAGQHPDLSALADALLGHMLETKAAAGSAAGPAPAPAAQQLATPAAAAPAPLAVSGGEHGVLSAAEMAAEEAAAAAAAAAAGTVAPSSAASGVSPSGGSIAGSTGGAAPPQRSAFAPAASAPSASSSAAAGGASCGPATPAVPIELRCSMAERAIKQRVQLAVDHFNKDPKKGFMALQEAKLLPASPTTGDEAADAAAKDLLAVRLGQYLRSCPGLSKTAVGELLGEPDAFFLKTLEAFTTAFDFTHLKFDSAIRMFLESFRLPGEAQKIDRIINAFGRHYYKHNSDVFHSADAAYVLAYSVIMLNTDQHNSQVKNKMTLESFQRNLRGVNEGTDFEPRFLEDIYYSIVKTALRLNESHTMDVSEQSLVALAQQSMTPRGVMVPASPGRQLFDTSMFRLMWGPAVHAMCAIVDSCSSEPLVNGALEGLKLAVQIAASHELEEVVDTVVVNLAKIPQQIAHSVAPRPDVAFARDAKARAVTATIAHIANRHGDCLRGGWVNVMDLLLGFYRQQLLPDRFTLALNGDGDGGLLVREGECSSLRTRRSLTRAATNSGSSSIFKHISSFTSILTLGGGGTSQGANADGDSSTVRSPGAGGPDVSDPERVALALADKVMEECAFQEVFMDSKFLKQESLVHLVRALITSSGPIPRPPSSALSWDCSELCLELLFTVLLRNRDRISLLWPRVMEYFQTIFAHSKEVDLVLVQKAIMGMMRLCQRLLPYKDAISEPLLRGVQLVALVDGQVASDLAPTIASEIQQLLKGAAPYIHSQPTWISICSLIKIIQYDPASYPACLETLTWVVKEALAPLNFSVVLQTSVDLLEQAILGASRSASGRGGSAAAGRDDHRAVHQQHMHAALRLILSAQEWLELWWQGAQVKYSPEQADQLGLDKFRQDSWLMVVGVLCKLCQNANVQVREHAVAQLQRCMVAAEKLAITPDMLSKAMDMHLLPLLKDLAKELGKDSKQGMQQVDVTARELVRVLSKVVLLYQTQLASQQGFCKLWRSLLDGMVAAITSASAPRGVGLEVLGEALPEAAKNMLLVMNSKGTLVEGWQDDDGTDMWEYTWRQARKLSPSLTPQGVFT